MKWSQKTFPHQSKCDVSIYNIRLDGGNTFSDHPDSEIDGRGRSFTIQQVWMVTK